MSPSISVSEVFLTGAKGFSEALTHLSFTCLAVPEHIARLRPCMPLSPKYVGPFSVFMWSFFIIRVFLERWEGVLFQVLLAPRAPLKCLWMPFIHLQACERSLWCGRVET